MYLENFIVVILQSSAVHLKPNPSQGLKLHGITSYLRSPVVHLKPNPSQGLKPIRQRFYSIASPVHLKPNPSQGLKQGCFYLCRLTIKSILNLIPLRD